MSNAARIAQYEARKAKVLTLIEGIETQGQTFEEADDDGQTRDVTAERLARAQLAVRDLDRTITLWRSFRVG